MSHTYQLLVIGAGPAGYVAAIRAAQLGMTVCLVEGRETLGGTCLNVGCIPSKALLESSQKFHAATHDFAQHGIKVRPALDLKTMLNRKDGVVKQLTSGIGLLMQKNKITVKHGWATLTGRHTVVLDRQEELSAERILIAAGSTPIALPFAPFDHDKIIDSTDALSLPNVPKHLAIIGAGVIGLEMASVWSRLGADVTLIDVAERPLAVMDADLGLAAQKIFTAQGLTFKLGAKVMDIKPNRTDVEILLADGKIKADKVLVAVGRKANTASLGLADVGIATDERGVIQVNAHYQTNIPSIYAVGDCIPGPMLAHKGEEEGIAAVELMAGQAGHVNYHTIPWVVYTHPELAGVGFTEAQAREQQRAIKVGKFNFAANGRALAVGETAGFVKVIADQKTDQLLGVHIIGHTASELIAEATLAIEFGASAEDLARTCHSHPTLSEAVKEAALAVDKRAIHS